MTNTSYVWKLAIGLLGLFLLLICSGCSGLGIEIMPRSKIEVQGQEHHRKSLQAAMDVFEQGQYPEAKTQFKQIATKAQTRKIKEQAQLGAVLSDILSAGTLNAIQGPENEFTEMMQEASWTMSMDMHLIRPFIQIWRENKVYKEENNTLRTEKKEAMDTIQDLQQENQKLQNKILELEDLFELIDEQKRRLIPQSP